MIVAAGAAFRLLSFERFHNDHFAHLSRAQQMTLGERPFRDFDDPGFPLQVTISAVGLRIQPTLLPELLIGAVAFGLAAGITWAAVALLTGSASAAWFAVMLQLAAYPRLYSYPKLLVHALVALGLTLYARKPSRARIVALAAITVVAGLFRYDHAVYAGLACSATLAVVHGRRSAGPIALLAVAALVLVSPFLAFLYVNGGITASFGAAWRFSDAEANRTVGSIGVWLFAVSIPLLAVAMIRTRGRQIEPRDAAIIGIAMLAAMLCAALLRDQLMVRLPDVYAPVSIVCAWLCCELWRVPSPRTRIAMRTAVLLLALAATAVTFRAGDTVHELFETRLLEGPNVLAAHVRDSLAAFRQWPWTGVMPDERLEPLVRRIGLCTAATDRIAVVGFAPELPFLARRRFAGRQPSLLPGYVESSADRDRLRANLLANPPAVVLVDTQDAGSVAQDLPPVEELLRGYTIEGRTTAGPLALNVWVRPGISGCA